MESLCGAQKSFLGLASSNRETLKQNKSLCINKGDEKCSRCKEEEGDLHIFFSCPKNIPLVKRFGDYVQCKGKYLWSSKNVLIGESIDGLMSLWKVLRTKNRLSFKLCILDAIFNDFSQNYFIMKDFFCQNRENICHKEFEVARQ